MITLNDTINFKMTLLEANFVASTLHVASLELKKSDPETAKNLEKTREKILNVLDSVDFSENEKLVDEINVDISKKA